MPLQDDLPSALRALRTRAGLAQGDLRGRGGPPLSTVSKLEAGVRPPDFRTVATYLDALGLDLRDLADALAEQRGERPKGSPGRARASWVEGLRQRGVDRDVLFGFAYGALSGDDPQAEADLVASAEEAARLIATAVLDERRALELERELEVAEPKAPYAPRKPARPR